jgi:hypothetical protein
MKLFFIICIFITVNSGLYSQHLLNNYVYLVKDSKLDSIKVSDSYITVKSQTNTKPPLRSTSDCNSIQCLGVTQDKKRCKNKTTNCNQRCHLH